MSSKPGRLTSAAGRWAIYGEQILAIVDADLRKLKNDPYELLYRMVQPVIWILIFGQAMAKTLSTSSIAYLDYMSPGILAQSILLVAIFYGIALIWERDMGILHKILVTPAPRLLIVLGRSVAAGIRGLAQVSVVYLLSFFLGIDLRLEFFPFCGVICLSLLLAAIFSTFSLIVACVVKKRERFMGIGQTIIMPLFFASNALYPIDRMPDWIRILSFCNPLTYLVDALRSLMIGSEPSHFGLGLDFAVGIGVYILVVAIATKLYPRIIY